MDGLISPDAITVAARSGRQDHAKKRVALGPQRIGLPVFLTEHPYDEEYARYAFVDSDLRLFSGTKDLQFFGITAVTGDFTPDHAFQTIAVGGTVNVLNTGKWAIRQLDVIYAMYEQQTSAFATSGNNWSTEFHNPTLDEFQEPCAIVCAAENCHYFSSNQYNRVRIGIALSADHGGGGRTGAHSFSLLMDLPRQRA